VPYVPPLASASPDHPEGRGKGDSVDHGVAWRGMAWHGMAGRGVGRAGQGRLWHGTGQTSYAFIPTVSPIPSGPATARNEGRLNYVQYATTTLGKKKRNEMHHIPPHAV